MRHHIVKMVVRIGVLPALRWSFLVLLLEVCRWVLTSLSISVNTHTVSLNVKLGNLVCLVVHLSFGSIAFCTVLHFLQDTFQAQHEHSMYAELAACRWTILVLHVDIWEHIKPSSMMTFMSTD